METYKVLSDLFTQNEHKDIAFEILSYLIWEEIILLASCSTLFFKSINPIVKNTKLITKISNPIKGILFQSVGGEYFCDSEISNHTDEIEKAILKITAHIGEFKYSYNIERKKIRTHRYVYLHPSGDQIHSVKFEEDDNYNTEDFFSDFEECFETLYEYRSFTEGIQVQIGVKGSHPFLYLKDPETKKTWFWGQSDGSSEFPFITNEKDLNLLPFYSDDFNYLDPSRY